MPKSARNAILAFIAATALPLATAHAASRNSSDVLRYIPADTPFVLASVEPLPETLAEKFEPTINRTLLAYQRVIRYSLDEELAELSEEEEGDLEGLKLRALVDELLSLMSLERIRGAGVQRDSAFAFYGNGLLPVFRVELSDAKLFESAIERLEDKAGKKLSVATVSGKPYRYVELEDLRLVIGIFDEQAIFTAVPTAFDEKQLSVAFGLKKPRKNLAKSRELRSIARQYGFTDHFRGFINSERVARIFFDDPKGLNKDLLGLMGYDATKFSDVCKAEFMELAGVAPRMVFGYTALNDEYIDSGFIVELRSDIAKGLATLPTAVPGLGQDYGGLMSIGFSLDPLAARQFYEGRLDALESDPFECEMLSGIQNSVAAGREALNKPVPPVVYSFRGILAVIRDIQGLDVDSKKPPESMDASFLFAIENAQDLITMAAMMDPQIAALNMLPDGKPVKLEMPRLATFADEAYAALSDGALSVSLGEGSEAIAENMLVAESTEPAPFVSVGMDTARYYGFIGDAMMAQEPEGSEMEMPLEVRTALKDAMTLIGELYTRMRMDVRLTPRGIELTSRMTLAD